MLNKEISGAKLNTLIVISLKKTLQSYIENRNYAKSFQSIQQRLYFVHIWKRGDLSTWTFNR